MLARQPWAPRGRKRGFRARYWGQQDSHQIADGGVLGYRAAEAGWPVTWARPALERTLISISGSLHVGFGRRTAAPTPRSWSFPFCRGHASPLMARPPAPAARWRGRAAPPAFHRIHHRQPLDGVLGHQVQRFGNGVVVCTVMAGAVISSAAVSSASGRAAVISSWPPTRLRRRASNPGCAA